MPPDPPRKLAPSALVRRLVAPKKIRVRCFQIYIRNLKKSVENPEQLIYEFYVLELRDKEINVEKIIAVTDANYAELRKRA